MINVGIVGASGYTGLELIKMLIAHPGFKLSYVATTHGKSDINALHPALEGVMNLPVEKADPKEVIKRCELVFLALPHKASMGFAKHLLESGIKVVDLSADYRLKRETYEAAYCPHEDPAHLNDAVYALIEYYRDALKNTDLAAGPGCYPTATLLGILPFMEHIDTSVPLFIDAKSGVSGAGKKLSETGHFVTINDNIFAYNPLKHRHAPEIAEKIAHVSGQSIDVNFVPHLIPATRGELVSIYAKLKEPINPLEVLRARYDSEPFVRVRTTPPSIKQTAGTHFCDVFAARNGLSLFVSSSIDNLLRGASSQALVAANLMCGFDEATGLPTVAYMP